MIKQWTEYSKYMYIVNSRVKYFLAIIFDIFELFEKDYYFGLWDYTILFYNLTENIWGGGGGR